MMYEDIIVKIKIANPNKIWYEEVLNKTLKSGDLVEVKQSDIPPTSRVKVLCKCELCNNDFERIRKDVKERTFCGLKCRNQFLKSVNPNPSIEKISVSCNVCEIKFEVHPSKYKKQENFLCSRECYKKHRSIEYKGDKIYNYQNIVVNCSNKGCNKEVKLCNFDVDNRKNHFCSPECYWSHRKDNYTELYYNGLSLNENRPETIPESKVRVFLEENGIEYIQEYNIDRYFIDFYLPKYNLAIEVYGDYWHCNPKIYGDGKRKIHKNQENVREYDRKRNTFLEKIVNKVYIVWEYDINNNFENCMGTVLEVLLLQESVTTTRQSPVTIG